MSTSASDRSSSPDIESISTVLSTSSEDLDYGMAEHAYSATGIAITQWDIRKNERFYFHDDNVELIVGQDPSIFIQYSLDILG